MIITVGVKALNEENRIAAALESALRAVEPFAGEVILADSGSADGTVAIARRFPVRIFQLADPTERSSAASAQLAFQNARGDYFYILDGDMVLDADFLRVAIACLDANPDVAAVGGSITERNLKAEPFRIQADVARTEKNRQPGLVDRLDGGGLYRSSAVRDAGYFADRNLHAFEEFELAARLQVHGWKLARINRAAADHYGHDVGGYQLLWCRLRSGYFGGIGEVMRGALGGHHLRVVLSRFKHAYYAMAVICWWLTLIACSWLSSVLLIVALTAPVMLLWVRRRSLALALYSLASWNASALGLMMGFCRRRVSAREPVASFAISSGSEVAPEF